ncbi:MAG: 3-oxoacyl-ACP synthase III [Anaerolineae bacterium]|nr:3-oxoacyl-ACP synthase III [Anaerolineae bacterium]
MSGNVCIEGLAYELGPHVVTSEWIEAQIADTMERLWIPQGQIERMTGIKQRRWWDAGIQPSEAATLAARKLIDQTGINPDEIGVLINSSVCRDYIEPSTAALIHGNLKLSPRCMSMDIGNACLGTISATQTVSMMIDSGMINYGLIVCAESSRDGIESTIKLLQSSQASMQDYKDNVASLTIGSGAVAMLLTHKDRSRTGHTINGVVNLAATEFNDLCVATSKESMRTNTAALMTEGIALAGRTWALASDTLANWSDDTIDRYVPHQVSVRQIEGMAKTMGISREKIQLNVETQGNMAAAALPITLAQAAEEGTITTANHVGLLGIGSGLNCSMMSVTW